MISEFSSNFHVLWKKKHNKIWPALSDNDVEKEQYYFGATTLMSADEIRFLLLWLLFGLYLHQKWKSHLIGHVIVFLCVCAFFDGFSHQFIVVFDFRIGVYLSSRINFSFIYAQNLRIILISARTLRIIWQANFSRQECQ